MTDSPSSDSLISKPPAELSAPRFHPGLGQGIAAIGLAAFVAFRISSAHWADPIAPRLALAGFAVFFLALAVGSSRMLGLSSLGVLGSALWASTLTNTSTWVEPALIGCIWYLSVELGWDSIERRDGASRSVSYNLRRVQEVSTVLTICLAIVWISFVATDLGPARTVLGRLVFLLAIGAALSFAIGHITGTAPKPNSET